MQNPENNRLLKYPEIILRLPPADVSVKGVKAWILQGKEHQLVFFEMESSTLLPEHCHDYDQWGLVINGKMELTVDGKTRICETGDEYIIPAFQKHSARFLCKSRVMDLFSEKSRYRIKLT